MGRVFTDKFSLLHFACGIIVYYWGMSFDAWFVIHGLFEILENTQTGMKYINQISLWPGGKNEKDTVINSIGDQFYATLGWSCAWFICFYS
jgi:hypothetical protein